MNRKKIKQEAREMIKGNIWEVLKPYLIVSLITFAASIVISPGISFSDEMELGAMMSSLSFDLILSIAAYPLTFGCVVYILKFVRKEPYDLKMLFEQYKKFWPIFCMYFLIELFIGLWSLLFIIPGIIATISYTMAPYLMADGEDNSMECIKNSKAMMKGYKWDYFKFQFSFFWWYCLGMITFGLAFIYIFPYMTVAQTLYYEELKKVHAPVNEK